MIEVLKIAVCLLCIQCCNRKLIYRYKLQAGRLPAAEPSMALPDEFNIGPAGIGGLRGRPGGAKYSAKQPDGKSISQDHVPQCCNKFSDLISQRSLASQMEIGS